MSKWLNVGKIVNTHGVRGEVRVLSTTDFEDDRFSSGKTLYVMPPNQNERVAVTVASHRKHKNFDLLCFEGYPSINDVEAFKGGRLQVPIEDRPELGEGEFFYHEIIGCSVVTIAGEELGKVKEILSPGANDVWVVQCRRGGKDLLIPYIEQVVKQVDLEKQQITIEPMEGLLE
ncbi:ribosome maturation factor RimM [Halalkalibacterium halodurans]|uniref:Ribosome maturation factor RimM n=1 Tax=Halalkalibacterium halodurans TaxID=86665 RepID=A0A0M0KIW0_ALKHA|nr:ribosome maturation factor RimM [Halalkalibacterium halodurans]TPE68067.1 ribosome maturation factor RimM [Halalkalibacterium halodurans]